MGEIKSLRNEVDRLDEKIAKALSQRMKVVEKIGVIKRKEGIPVKHEKREEEILKNVTRIAEKKGVNTEAIRKVFERVISLSRMNQESFSPKIAFQGEMGAYSEAAIRKAFCKPVLIPCRDFTEIFEKVESNEADSGMVPVENSTEGSVNQVYDLLLERNLFIIGEFPLRIEHCLIGFPNSEIREVYSHPQALGQCRKFLEKNGLKSLAFYDTAGAVKMIKKKGLRNAAAIASDSAAKHYDMKVIEKGIEDNKNNYTRFVIISRKPSDSTSEDKTSVIFTVKNRPGGLNSVLEEFAKRGINLTKIESRPTKEKPWEYVFYLDFEGNPKERKCKEALEKIKDKSVFVKVLGSYGEVRECFTN